MTPERFAAEVLGRGARSDSGCISATAWSGWPALTVRAWSSAAAVRAWWARLSGLCAAAHGDASGWQSRLASCVDGWTCPQTFGQRASTARRRCPARAALDSRRSRSHSSRLRSPYCSRVAGRIQSQTASNEYTSGRSTSGYRHRTCRDGEHRVLNVPARRSARAASRAAGSAPRRRLNLSTNSACTAFHRGSSSTSHTAANPRPVART